MDIAPSVDSKAAAKVYINEILDKANKFMWTRSVWSQDELKHSLNRIVNEGRGEYCCILGGANTGKSLVLSELTRSANQSVALVDMRGTSSILSRFTCAYNEDNSAVFDAALLEVVKTLPSPPSVAGSLVTDNSTPDARLQHFLDNKDLCDFEKLYKLLSEVAKLSPKNAAGCGLTLIIDQANIAFTDRWGEDARDTLSMFVALTKEQHLVSYMFHVLPCIHRAYLTYIVLCMCLLSD